MVKKDCNLKIFAFLSLNLSKTVVKIDLTNCLKLTVNF